jgi:peptidoglycan L-alanyl-D-glutamate endopeptidase CwlK
VAFQFGERSLLNLRGVHPDLVRLCHAALERSEVDFGVIEGLRTLARQKQLFDQVPPVTWTMKSRHLTGHAIDFLCYVDGVGTWAPELYPRVAQAFKDASMVLEIPIVWGGDWTAPQTDSDHIELDRNFYPDTTPVA